MPSPPSDVAINRTLAVLAALPELHNLGVENVHEQLAALAANDELGYERAKAKSRMRQAREAVAALLQTYMAPGHTVMDEHHATRRGSGYFRRTASNIAHELVHAAQWREAKAGQRFQRSMSEWLNELHLSSP